jgi:hypothetical protein
MTWWWWWLQSVPPKMVRVCCVYGWDGSTIHNRRPRPVRFGQYDSYYFPRPPRSSHKNSVSTRSIDQRMQRIVGSWDHTPSARYRCNPFLTHDAEPYRGKRDLPSNLPVRPNRRTQLRHIIILWPHIFYYEHRLFIFAALLCQHATIRSFIERLDTIASYCEYG